MKDIYPLLFQPIPFEKRFWGGSRLAEMFHKDFPPGARIGESWEISDYPGSESRVINGPLAGRSLRQLVETRAGDIVGDETVLEDGRFPLLVKYIDAKETLSVQVHPGDDYAREHENGSGKKEAWYVIHTDPGAKLIRGVTPGTTREKFAAAIAAGELDPRLHTFEPKPGDVIMIPWGTVHAIGAGIIVAEVQQTSDITYRVYDWNRIDEGGRARELHVDKALDVIRFEPPKHDTCERRLLDDGPSKRFEGVRCNKFVLEILELNGSLPDAAPPDRFAILNVVRGNAVLESATGQTPLPLGATALIPATMPPYRLRGTDVTVLRSYVPDAGSV